MWVLETFYERFLCEDTREFCARRGRYIYEPMPVYMQAIVLLLMIFALLFVAFIVFIAMCAVFSAVKTYPAIFAFLGFAFFVLLCVAWVLNKMFAKNYEVKKK